LEPAQGETKNFNLLLKGAPIAQRKKGVGAKD